MKIAPKWAKLQKKTCKKGWSQLFFFNCLKTKAGPEKSFKNCQKVQTSAKSVETVQKKVPQGAKKTEKLKKLSKK